MPHQTDIHVGKQLRLRRTILGLSQEMVGKALGITFQQVQKYERGVNRMGASRLFDLAKYLSVPVSYFFEGLGGAPRSVSGVAEGISEFEHEKISSRETLELIRTFHKIKSPEVRGRFIDLGKALAEERAVA